MNPAHDINKRYLHHGRHLPKMVRLLPAGCRHPRPVLITANSMNMKRAGDGRCYRRAHTITFVVRERHSSWKDLPYLGPAITSQLGAAPGGCHNSFRSRALILPHALRSDRTIFLGRERWRLTTMDGGLGSWISFLRSQADPVHFRKEYMHCRVEIAIYHFILRVGADIGVQGQRDYCRPGGAQLSQ